MPLNIVVNFNAPASRPSRRRLNGRLRQPGGVILVVQGELRDDVER